jgi:hypothetical protein
MISILSAKIFADFFNFAILRQVQWRADDGQRRTKLRGTPALWFPGPLKFQFSFAFFFGREDQPVLLRSRAICRLSRIFSEILQDRHRPPSDLADGLMRNSSSGQKRLIGQKSGVLRSLGEDFMGRQPLHGKLNFFSDVTSL